jgi:dihydroceramidase
VVVFSQYVTGESTVQQIVFTSMVYWLWHTCFRLIRDMEGDGRAKSRMWWMAVSGIGKTPSLFYASSENLS